MKKDPNQKRRENTKENMMGKMRIKTAIHPAQWKKNQMRKIKHLLMRNQVRLAQYVNLNKDLNDIFRIIFSRLEDEERTTSPYII